MANQFHPLQVLVRRRWQLFACLLIVVGIAFASMYFSRPKYEAIAQIKLVLDNSQKNQLNNTLQTYSELLHSPVILEEVAKRLDWPARNNEDSQEFIEQLRSRIQIQPIPNSRLIDVICNSDSGKMAAELANKVASVFVETTIREQQNNQKHVAEQLKQQILEYDREIRGLEDNLYNFRKEHKFTESTGSLTVVNDRLNKLEHELTQVRLQKLDIETQNRQLKNILDNADNNEADVPFSEADTELTAMLDALDITGKDYGIDTMRQKLQVLQQEQARLAQVYLPGHRKLQDVRMQIADLTTRLRQARQRMVETAFEKTLTEYMVLTEREKSLQAMLNEQKELGVHYSRLQQEYKNLQTNLDIAVQFKNNCITRLRQITMENNLNNIPIEIANSARVPVKPKGLNPAHRAASILVLGLLFSLIFILALDRMSMGPIEEAQPAAAMMAANYGMPWPVVYWPGGAGPPVNMDTSSPAKGMDNTRTRSAKASSILGYLRGIDLGGISQDDLAFAARCRIVHTDPRSRQAQTFREITARLLSQYGNEHQGIAICSKERQSGKTTCACNLALSLAQTGRQVVVVDCHHQAPALERIFPCNTDQPDITAVLADPGRIADALQETDIANLDILPCHQQSSHLPQNGTATMRQLHQYLTEKYDWVIYDTGNLQGSLTDNLLQVVGKAVTISSSDDPFLQQETERSLELSRAECLGSIINCPQRSETTTTRSTHTVPQS